MWIAAARLSRRPEVSELVRENRVELRRGQAIANIFGQQQHGRKMPKTPGSSRAGEESTGIGSWSDSDVAVRRMRRRDRQRLSQVARQIANPQAQIESRTVGHRLGFDCNGGLRRQRSESETAARSARRPGSPERLRPAAQHESRSVGRSRTKSENGTRNFTDGGRPERMPHRGSVLPEQQGEQRDRGRKQLSIARDG
jgi:hypothetical protein